MKLFTLLFAVSLFAVSLFAQTPPTPPTIVTVNANVQILSAQTVKAKYLIKLPKGITAGSAVVENTTSSVLYIGQGSVMIALRNNGYPVLDMNSASAIVLHAQRRGVLGFISSTAPFASKLSTDVTGLIVSGVVHVSPGIGATVAGIAQVLQQITPDVVSQIAAIQQLYSTDGLQSLISLAPGQSATAIVLMDSPPKAKDVEPHTFDVPVLVVQPAATNVPQR